MKNLTEFLDMGYTSYHVTENVCGMLSENGFTELKLGGYWKLEENGKYFVVENGSSVVAFRLGDNKVFNLCLSHTDSPSLKIKGNGVIKGESTIRLNVEKYGGGLLYTFFDRPLKIAGRILAETESGITQKTTVSDYNVIIPSVAIHHNPSANESFSVNVQADMLPLFSQDSNGLYESLTADKIIDADLFAVPATKAFYAGVNGEFLCSPRLDNLTSVYAEVSALINCNPQNIAVIACLDNEEIGSRTLQGSPLFVERVLRSLARALRMDDAAYNKAAECGLALSVDNSHASHPGHPEKSDPVFKTHMNQGVVVKHHTNYATDGLTSAVFKKLCDVANVKFQDYYNNSAVRCGSTMGLAASSVLGIKTCDIGIAQLAMHSACETCGSSDVAAMEKCLTSFLSAELCCGGGNVVLNARINQSDK